jgi:hypothetical protein
MPRKLILPSLPLPCLCVQLRSLLLHAFDSLTRTSPRLPGQCQLENAAGPQATQAPHVGTIEPYLSYTDN